MGGLTSTVTNVSIFRMPVPAKISNDMASSGWLKLAALFCFVRKVYLKINPFVTVLGQDCKVIDQHSYLIHSR